MLPITVTERDDIAVGVGEGVIPSLEACAAVHEKQAQFHQGLDWNGAGKDTERQVESPEKGYSIVIVVHRVPRFAACAQDELSSRWKDSTLAKRITTMTFQDGDVEYVAEDAERKGILAWTAATAWCGQTVLTFVNHLEGDSATG